MLTTKALIGKGYFPDNIIPPLNTTHLANILDELTLDNLESIIKSNGLNESKCCLHSTPRTQNLRRNFYIPNPLHQIRLCHCIENNWPEIKTFISDSPISLSSPIIIEDWPRSFKRKADWREKRQQLALRSTAYRTMLKTDISRYYQTIYTHSIPWALHGKETAKANPNNFKDYFGNCLDLYVRCGMESQTIGIPTGPDSSHIISEIIGRSIERELEKSLTDYNIELKGVRFIDDFALFFKSRHDAEVALHKIHDSLKYYELEINPNKTEIVDLPAILEIDWVSNLRNFNFRNIDGKDKSTAVRIQNTDIFNFFSRSFEYYKKHPDDNTLLYTLKRIKEQEILPENWSIFESFILKSAIYEGSCIPVVVKILKIYEDAGFSLDKSKISSVISEIIKYHSKFSHGYEISWALWLAKELNIQIEAEIEEIISRCDDSIVVLVALDLMKSNLLNSKIDTSIWCNFMNRDQLYDDHWLLAYEANIKKWLPIEGKNYIMTDPFFKILKKHNIHFYDPEASVMSYPDLTEKSGYQ